MANIAVFLEKKGSLLCPRSMAAVRVGRLLATGWGGTLYGVALVQEASQLPEIIEISSREGIDKVIAVMAPMISVDEPSSASLAPAILPVTTRYSFGVFLFGASVGSFELASSIAAHRSSYFVSNMEVEKGDDGSMLLVHALPGTRRVIRWSPRTMEKFLVGLVHAPPYEAPRGSEDEVDAVASRSTATLRFSWLFMDRHTTGEDSRFYVILGTKAHQFKDSLIQWGQRVGVPVFLSPASYPEPSPWGRLCASPMSASADGAVMIGLDEKDVLRVLPGVHLARRVALVDTTLPAGVTFPYIMPWDGPSEEFIRMVIEEYAV